MAPRIGNWLYTTFGRELPMPSHLFFLCLSIALACAVLLWYQRKYELHERALYTFLILAIPALFLGGKLVYALQFPHNFTRGSSFLLGGGAALYGGMLGVVSAGWFTAYIYRISVRPYLDGLALALALGLFTGRIGCFLSGCNHGTVTELPWGVCYPLGSHAFRQQLNDGLVSGLTYLSLPVHPVQLYEALLGLILFFVGFRLLRNRRFEGQVFVSLMTTYAVFRFLTEFIRADQHGTWLGPLTFAQVLSLLLFFSIMVLFYRLRNQASLNVAHRNEESTVSTT